MTNSILQRYFLKTLSFFFCSLAGLLVDLSVFQLLVYLQFTPFTANMVSASLAIITTYCFVTRYTFQKSARLTTFTLFFGYYAVSITCFSALIEYLVEASHWLPIVCKLLTLPFSFLVNFFFSNLIIGRQKNG